jgi:AcrR family transcriptional regulator
MSKSAEDVKRPYDSPLRRDQARATRRVIVTAAGELFAKNGYVTTSIEDVAAAAGVSRATVFSSVGGKAALLKEAYDVAIVGDDEPVRLADRPRSREIQAIPDARAFLDAYADLLCDIYERVAGIHEAVRAAAHADPEIRELWDSINEQRRGGSGRIFASLIARGPVRAGVDLRTGGDIMWTLNDAGLYHLLVQRRGWSRKKFHRWLADTMQLQLLPPRPTR